METGESAAVPDLGSIERFARLAASIARAPARLTVRLGDATLSASAGGASGSAADEWTSLPLFGDDGSALGSLAVLPPPGRPVTPDQEGALRDLAGLVVGSLGLERRTAGLMLAAALASRTDHMLRLASEARSCTDALASMLRELCRHHGAAAGRIWRMDPAGEILHEVSRYDDAPEAGHKGRRSPATVAPCADAKVAEAIHSNEPRVLLCPSLSSGLMCQVSFPIWVQEERFGLCLAFRTERQDVPEIIANLTSLANTMRPVLLREASEERIRFIAHHDSLTQLANRLVFQERMNDAVAAASRGEHGLALLYLDLDGFKSINDLRGHEVGDRLLAAVAARLRGAVGDRDTAARIGGDEFAVLQPVGGQPDAAIALAHRLLDRIGQPYEVDNQRLVIGVSVGIAFYPGDGDTPDVLLRNADTALYRAKEAGRHTFRVFDPSMDTRQQERLLIERDLGDAINDRKLTLAYQPICDALTLDIQGYEALLRWDHPTRGPIQPDRFVPLAEQSGMILQLGQWALEAACAEAASWPKPLRLSVNLSPVQFRQPHLPALVADVLARTGFPAGRLDLEVTEGLLLDDSGLVLRTMHALKQQGIGITLDDFGTAYASLSYLRRFPFDRIKIDKSFVQPVCTDDATLAIVQAILSLSARLKLSVVAEGVETDEQLQMLRRLGCRLIQGFRTGSPVIGHEVRASHWPDGSAGHQEVEVATLIGL